MRKTLLGREKVRVKSVAMRAQGDLIASGSRNGTVRVWMINEGQRIRHTLTGHASSISDIAVCNGMDRIVTGSQDCFVGVWTLLGNEWVKEMLTGDSTLMCVSISGDG